MYVYALCIGMKFEDIAKIMMSDVGKVINELLEGNIFSKTEGFQSISDKLFNYISEGPKDMLAKFDISRDYDGNSIISPLWVFTQAFNKKMGSNYNSTDKGKLAKGIKEFCQNTMSLQDKFIFLNKLRGEYNASSRVGKEVYNQLIDFIQDYAYQQNIIINNVSTYRDIYKLSQGAEELRQLGQMFGLNKGLKNSSEELIKNQVNNFERCIYNKTKKEEDIIDLQRFVLDSQYRNRCIKGYEGVKHSFNILEAMTVTPHYRGYLETLAVADQALKTNTFKYRSCRQLTLDLAQELHYFKEDNITKGVSNFVGDFLRKNWMLSEDLTIFIPKKNKAFTQTGTEFVLKQDTPIRLGTDWGDNTFRAWMETEVIPNLKKGKIQAGRGISLISDNKFIKDLVTDLRTTTISKNPSVVYTLPINMFPQTDFERTEFNNYKAEFNKLAKFSYEYKINTYVTDESGKKIKQEVTKRIPLVDLFTYYAMIAFDWKLGANSLTSILKDFNNTGVIDKFHKYTAYLDKSGFTLNIKNNPELLQDIIPYVIPFESPYKSFAQKIRYKHPVTRKYTIMYRRQKTQNWGDDIGMDDIIEDIMEEEGAVNSIKDYEFETSNIDTNYFTKGAIEQPYISKKLSIRYDGHDYGLGIIYSKDTDEISKLFINGSLQDLSKFNLKKMPFRKLNNRKVIDTVTLQNVIINGLNLNNCS